MDIYSLINSQTVAEHCGKTGFAFRMNEQAYIIDACDHISLYEKHRLFETLMRTMPDFPLTAEKSFFTVLKRYLRAQKDLLGLFESIDGDSGCQKVRFAVSDCGYDLCHRSKDMIDAECSSFVEAYETIVSHRERRSMSFGGLQGYISIMREDGAGESGASVHPLLCFGRDAILTAVRSDEINQLYALLFVPAVVREYGLIYCGPNRIGTGKVPVPFQTGDLVVEAFSYDEDAGSCIFVGMKPCRFGNELVYLAEALRLDQDGVLVKTVIDPFSADRYHGPFTPELMKLQGLAEPFLQIRSGQYDQHGIF